MISKKRLVLISVLTILLVVGGLYATYAINVFEEEVTPTEYDMAFNFDLSGSVTREMTVEAGKTKVFDVDITNPYSDTIQYGVAYSLVSPTTLPSGVTIAESSISKNSAVGMIDANETLSVSIVVVNETSSSVTLSFSVINGYKNGGDLIVPTGKTLVEGSYEVVPPASLQTLNRLGLKGNLKVVKPDFTKISPAVIDYKEGTQAYSTYSLNTTRSQYYVTYADSYDFNVNTAKFTLKNENGSAVSAEKYSSVYSDLVGKYVVYYSLTSSPTSYTNLSVIYKVTSATYDASTLTGEIEYQGIVGVDDTYDFADTGIYVAEDNLGMSYYFRGAVENNYVYFANSYWRIIRINGDGTIRMIYDGTSAHENGESSTDRYTINKNFSLTEGDNAYLGYMTGTIGIASDVENGYNQTHSNSSDSVVKNYLENTWYANNIKDTDYEQYIADAIYCNDRSLSSGTGIGITETKYSAYYRMTNYIPSLICNQSNDRFTYKSSNFEIKTNGILNAPVGLITVDEVAMAGGLYIKANKKFFLYSGFNSWTMSPKEFLVDSSYSYGTLFEFGYETMSITELPPGFSSAIRPVISIKPETIKYGDGTMGNPFRLEEEI